MSYLDNLHWRYATKRMNGEPVPAQQVNNILEAVRLAPSSLGLQPYTVMVVEDAALRAKLAPAINNQPQITEGSVLLVFAAWTAFGPEKIDEYIRHIATTRKVSIESLEGFRKSIEKSIQSKGDNLLQWTARQAYIGLGYATFAAAMEKVDATPMEGFSPEKLDAALALAEKGLSAVALVTLGFRDASADKLAHAAKVRRPAASFFHHPADTVK